MTRTKFSKLLGALAASFMSASIATAQDQPAAPPSVEVGSQMLTSPMAPVASTSTLAPAQYPGLVGVAPETVTQPGYPSTGCGPGGCGPTADDWPVLLGPCVSPMNYLNVDFVYLERDVDNEKVLLGFETAAGVGTFKMREDAFNFEPALRVTFGQALIDVSACDVFFEMTYLGLHHSNATFGSPPFPGVNYFGSLFPPIISNLDSQLVEYVSDLNSFEANLKIDYFVDRRLYLLAGFRYIRFDDRFKVTEDGFVDLNAGGAAATRAFREIQVIDNLVGLQVGFDWNSNDRGSRWQFGVFGRAGVYGNVAESEIEQIVTVGPEGVPLASSASPGRTKLAGAVEGGFVSSFHLARNLVLRGGYQFLWLGHIALAPDQATPDLINGAYNARLKVNSDVFMHGPFAGLEWRWGCCR